MDSFENEPWYLQICEEWDKFSKKVDEKIDREQQQLKACKKRNELENKIAQELNVKNELTEQLAELNRRSEKLEKATAVLKSRLTIAESDQHRLDTAKEHYQMAKELTGIRFDFSAPPDIAKGYVMNKTRKVLLPFEVSDSDALWDLVKAASDPSWPDLNKENCEPN